MNELTLKIIRQINNNGLTSYVTHNSVGKLIVFALDEGPKTSFEIANIIGFAVSTIRIHLRALRSSNFIIKQNNKYSLNQFSINE